MFPFSVQPVFLSFRIATGAGKANAHVHKCCIVQWCGGKYPLFFFYIFLIYFNFFFFACWFDVPCLPFFYFHTIYFKNISLFWQGKDASTMKRSTERPLCEGVHLQYGKLFNHWAVRSTQLHLYIMDHLLGFIFPTRLTYLTFLYSYVTSSRNMDTCIYFFTSLLCCQIASRQYISDNLLLLSCKTEAELMHAQSLCGG